MKCPEPDKYKHSHIEYYGKVSDVVGEQKSGSGRVRGLFFGIGSGSGIKISGTSPSGFRVFGVF